MRMKMMNANLATKLFDCKNSELAPTAAELENDDIVWFKDACAVPTFCAKDCPRFETDCVALDAILDNVDVTPLEGDASCSDIALYIILPTYGYGLVIENTILYEHTDISV